LRGNLQNKTEKKINFVVKKMKTKVNKEGGKNNDKKIDKMVLRLIFKTR